MAGWNLVLRFMLEVAAVAGLAAAAWQLTAGPGRWVTTIAAPAAAAAIWGLFNVPDDPSRSGAAPIEVTGPVRLVVELAILGVGAAAVAVATRPAVGMALGLAIVGHYLASLDRVAWLAEHRRSTRRQAAVPTTPTLVGT